MNHLSGMIVELCRYIGLDGFLDKDPTTGSVLIEDAHIMMNVRKVRIYFKMSFDIPYLKEEALAKDAVAAEFIKLTDSIKQSPMYAGEIRRLKEENEKLNVLLESKTKQCEELFKYKNYYVMQLRMKHGPKWKADAELLKLLNGDE